jgi:DNA modification methylase
MANSLPNVILTQGDCLEIMPTLTAGSVDLVLCDLPYGTTACKWDSVIPMSELWAEYTRLIRTGTCVVLFGSEPFSSTLRVSRLTWFKYDWIWDKVRPSGFQIAKYVPMKRHEIVSVFCSTSPQWHPIKEAREKPIKGRVCSKSDSSPLAHSDGLTRTYSDKNPQSILVFPKGSDGKYVHPTQKPVALMEYLIRTYTNPGDTVLDNCMGSGTTGVACVNTGRSFIGIEQDAAYFKIASERIAAAQKAWESSI